MAWSSLKKFMFEEDNSNSNNNTVINNGAATAVSTPVASMATNTFVSSPNVDSEKEKKVIESLLQLLDESNLPGPDFYEFYVALKEMQKLGAILDEAKLYQTVFTTLKITGLSKDKLSQSANQYLQILQNRNKEFQENHDAAVQQKVGTKVAEQNSIDKAISEKTALIETLKSEISGLNVKKQNLETEIQQETFNVQQTKNAFESGYAKLTNEISNQLQKINSFIQ